MSYVEGGAATKLLGELAHGGTVDASGPYGRFCLQDADAHPRYLLLATGTGVTPYRAMLPQLAELLAGGDREVVLLYGARNEAELLYDEEFAAFAAGPPGLHLPQLPEPPAARPSRAPATAWATSRRRCPSWRRQPSATSPTCAATPTWSMPPSPR